ncbi:MAG: cation-translocating P-type ATPase [Methylococcaceae bacterium]|nr:cation-translocating P-type ATPase [Prolixibacteraceae bacterium]
MWHSKSIDDVLVELNVDASLGLTEAEAKARLEKYGLNALKGQKRKNILQLFVAQLNDWLIYVLFAAVIITIFLGEYIDAIIIVLVILINAVLGVIQEVKAGNAIEALQKMSAPKALVKRDGQISEIDSEQLVPGDLLILDAGRFISADIRLIETANLQVEESALTGESVPSEKDALLIHEEKTPLGDRLNQAYMSSVVTSGRGAGVVIATGMNTEVGNIAKIIEAHEVAKTPLEIRLNQLGKTLGKMAIGICLFIFIISMIQGRNLANMFLVAVSLAVAAIPEGLAAIVAVVLSIGVTRMSKRNAIIRRLPAVETLGSVNIICSDKTGTLTQNKMTVTKYITSKGEISVERNKTNTADEDAKLLASTMILCSDATWNDGKGTGDPTEISLLMMGDDLGIDRSALLAANKRVAEYAFDSVRKLMSTLTEENGKYKVNTKGAIDNLFKKCTHVWFEGKQIPITEEHKTQYKKTTENMSNAALRTLGAAFKPVNEIIDPMEMEKDLILIGMVGMIDPPRQEVKQSIELAKNAGITSIMITGDHKNTAFAIAQELGIAERPDQAITGQEADELSEEEFSNKVSDLRVFARVSPEHKVKIVKALKAKGNIVSMTGDGVNDAPSLNEADIGVAMGISGTDVAKNASDMILTDDNFATIVTAIEEGRNIYNNIRKSVLFLLTCNLGEVFTMFITISLGWATPLLATQLLWINLLTDALPAVALGMDPGDPDVMKEKPRNPKDNFFSGNAGWIIFLGGLLISAITILAFWYGYYEHGYSPLEDNVPENSIAYARTMAFMTLISCQLFFSMAVRSSKKSIFSIGIFSNKYLVGAIILGLILQLAVIGIPFMQHAFKLQMLDLKGWIMIIVLGLVPLLFSEAYKFIARKRKKTEDQV